MEFLHKQYWIDYISHSKLGLPKDKLTQMPRNAQSLHLKFTATSRRCTAELSIIARNRKPKSWLNKHATETKECTRPQLSWRNHWNKLLSK